MKLFSWIVSTCYGISLDIHLNAVFPMPLLKWKILKQSVTSCYSTIQTISPEESVMSGYGYTKAGDILIVEYIKIYMVYLRLPLNVFCLFAERQTGCQRKDLTWHKKE